MFGLRNKLLGLDIGSRSIKAAVLQKKGGDVYLSDYVFHDLRANNMIAPSAGSQLNLVQAIIDGRGLRRHNVSGCIDDKDVQVAHLTFPEMSDEEISAAVINKIEAKTGIDGSELSIDHLIVGKIPASGSVEVLVRVYYTRMDVVRQQADFLEKTHLRPVSLESYLQATIETLRFNDYINTHDTCVVVDIGESHTSVGLVIGGNLAQLNTIKVGSGDINENLMNSFQCSYLEGEKMKLSYRLEKSDPGVAENMNRVIEDGYYRIILGIHDTISYYKAAFKDQLILNLLLTGGGAQKEGLAALMEQSLSIPTVVPNPLRKIQIFGKKNEKRENLPELAAHLHPAIGLALRGL